MNPARSNAGNGSGELSVAPMAKRCLNPAGKKSAAAERGSINYLECIIHRPDCLSGNSRFDLRFTSIFHEECADMDAVWNELREVVWLVSMITGLSVASVSLAVALATA